MAELVSSESSVRTPGSFAFHEQRQRFHIFANTTNESWVVADRVSEELVDLSPGPDGFRLLYAPMDNGIILTRTLRALHALHPDVPVLVVMKGRGLEDLRNTMGRLVDRMAEHPLSAFVMTNMYLREAVDLTKRSMDNPEDVVWRDVGLRGQRSYDFQGSGRRAVRRAGQGVAGPPGRERAAGLCRALGRRDLRSDRERELRPILPKPGDPELRYNYALLNHPYLHSHTMTFRLDYVLGPVFDRLADGGRMTVIQGYPKDAAHELVGRIWPEQALPVISRYDVIRDLRKALAGERFTVSGLTDTRALFRFDMHTLPVLEGHNLGTQSLSTAFNNAVYFTQLREELIQEAIHEGRRYLEITEQVLRENGGPLVPERGLLGDEKTRMIELDRSEAAKLAMCFAPSSAAIIGASTDPMKFGGRAMKFCLERGYRGRLYPVNARSGIVQGVKAYPSVGELPEAPDVAVIAVPAPLVRESLVAAGEKGAKIAIVYGAGFAETGEEGAARQRDLLDIARSGGMRMIGPNCMGVMSLASGFVASFTAAPEHHDGNGWPDVGSLSVASQSGAVGIQMFAQLRDRGLGLANWISTGNQADIDVADAIAYFATDDATKTIAVYMEDAGRGLKLLQALELARAARKPVVILKVGTTPLGGMAAAGHTASMYVEDRLVGDLLDQCGVLRAGSINELIDLAAACDAGVMPESNEVAAVSVSGGGAVMISDAAASGGLELPEYAPGDLEELKEVNSFVNDRNPIDISAPSMSNMAITGGHLKWGTERGHPTMLGYVSHVPLVPRTRVGILPRLMDLTAGSPDQLIAIAGNFHGEDRRELVRAGLAVFDDPTVATRSVAKLVRAGQAMAEAREEPEAPAPPAADIEAALAGAGVAMIDVRPVADEADALDALDAHSEIVLKLDAPGLRHRTELDGVRLLLGCREDVRRAFDDLSARIAEHGPRIPGLSIVAQRMVHGTEFLLGVRRDPNFGPLVLLGSGGTMCELLDDLTYRKTPISGRDAERMLGSVRMSRTLDGWRGAPPSDRNALLEAIEGLASAAPALPSLEINPFIVSGEGAFGVDLVIAETTG